MSTRWLSSFCHWEKWRSKIQWMQTIRLNVTEATDKQVLKAIMQQELKIRSTISYNTILSEFTKQDMLKKSTVYTYKIHIKFSIKLIIMIMEVER